MNSTSNTVRIFRELDGNLPGDKITHSLDDMYDLAINHVTDILKSLIDQPFSTPNDAIRFSITSIQELKKKK